MKKSIVLIAFFIVFIKLIDLVYLDNKIYDYINRYYLHKKYNIVINNDALRPNKYVYEEYSSYVKDTNNLYPSNKNELLNIYYSALNKGYKNFSYYCDEKYNKCLNDIEVLSKDSKTFTSLNQLIHPYNSFKTIESNYTNNRIDVSVNRKYSDDDINKINNKLNDIINELNINNYVDVKEKIKVFHDYIASTNVYDSQREKGNSKHNSDSALGTLFEGYSVCSGYTDTMALFLNMIGLENIKVATDKHVWNAVKLNDKWYHIDITWDDPVVSDGSNIIQYDYFLITTEELKKKNDKEHNYSEVIYDFIN